MITTSYRSQGSGSAIRSARGSVLLTAMVFALVMAVALTGYVNLSRTSLRLAHRTFFSDSAINLAETGLEEAVWMFNTMGSSANAAANKTLWTNNGWSCSSTIADVYMQSMGTGYTSVPTVTFSGGGGSGASGTAVIGTREQYVAGVLKTINCVTAITVTNGGSGYTSTPTITLTGGGGSGAIAVPRFAATRTLTFSNFDKGTSGTVKVWVAGYDGSSSAPIIVSKAAITPIDGAPIEKMVKVIVSKNGVVPKYGLVAKNGINWNGHPDADSYLSSTSPGLPPFSAYNPNTSRANTTVASLYGPTVDLSHGTVEGNVMIGSGVTVTGGTVSGQKINNFSYNFSMPTYPTNSGATAGYTLTTIPAVLPRTGATPDVPNAADGKYYYYVNNKTIGAVSITAGKNVVIVGTNTSMGGGLMVQSNATQVGSAEIYIDGPVSPGNSDINTTSWAGALKIWTTTTSNCTISGNGNFYGCLFAPFSALVGNGGGNDAADLCGSFIVASVTSNGHMCFHWDEALGSTTSAAPWSLALWTELQTVDDRAAYASKINF
jgi:hypothetical protein